MVAILRLILAVLLIAAVPAAAQQSGGSGYAVDGIDVDVAAPTPEAARSAAFRIAQRKGWTMLWSRLTGGPVSAAPKLNDSQLDSIVSGIESQGERFSMTRYIARLGVVFDRARSREFLGGTGITLQSPPMLLLPLNSDGGLRSLYQYRTPWRAAWLRFRENVTPIDYIIASGSPGDNVLLTGWQARRPDRPSWRNVLNRFDAVDVLVAESRLTRVWPGGPVTGLFIARHGPDGTELGRFSLASADEAGLTVMLDTAVRRIDEIYSAALQDGRLRSNPDLTAEMAPIIALGAAIGTPLTGGNGVDLDAEISSLEVAMATPDAATASALESALRGTPGVAGVTITSLSLGGTSRLIMNYAGSRDLLLYSLDGRGLRLAAENGETVLRRRREGEAPIPPPVIAAPVVAAPGAAPTAADPSAPPATSGVTRPGARTLPAAPATTPPAAGPTDLLPRPNA
ncbi:hypothetical protein GCM10011529_11250 [Polymorphobacter glacialis]|uniref:Heavy-metal-associated domain-containing protein n=1 Tax=Sandarakinorhabdus glacialis TaxID=1614636 RepID=A0A917E5K0_9SPHN|nr:heavy-metal-associated domain-containing protein [Polymorphobacter glacialis]GGE06617.1 hypothetical protein GCM10011529_11250 [Polymorphobacter glacialis]